MDAIRSNIFDLIGFALKHITMYFRNLLIWVKTHQNLHRINDDRPDAKNVLSIIRETNIWAQVTK
jgi:hypothetical protein